MLLAMTRRARREYNNMECAAVAALSNLQTTSRRAGPTLDPARLRGRSRFGAAKTRDPKRGVNASAPRSIILR